MQKMSALKLMPLLAKQIKTMNEMKQVYIVEVMTGEVDDRHEDSFFVSSPEPDSLNDVTRDFEGVSFCPVAESVAKECQIDYQLPQDRIALLNALREMSQGF